MLDNVHCRVDARMHESRFRRGPSSQIPETTAITYLYLTDNAEDGALEQSRVAKDLKVVKHSDLVFHVFKPTPTP
jgi:hypothetical protein